jgi:hypothetical protein
MDNQASQEFQGRRRSKPKFEIPIEAELTPAAGWLYRAADIPTQESPAEAAPPAPAALETGPLLTAGIGLFSLGFQIMGRICLTAASLASIPAMAARRLLILD